MNKLNKTLLFSLGLSIIILIIGSWLKINGNDSGKWMIPLALVAKPIFIITIIFYNRNSLKKLLK